MNELVSSTDLTAFSDMVAPCYGSDLQICTIHKLARTHQQSMKHDRPFDLTSALLSHNAHYIKTYSAVSKIVYGG